MMEEGLTIAGEKAAEAGMPGAAKAAGTGAAKAAAGTGAAKTAAGTTAAKAAGAGATKTAMGTTAAKAAGGKSLAAKALVFVPGIPILAVGGLVGIIAWEFWKGNQEAKEMQK